jgi:hypothetical protein
MLKIARLAGDERGDPQTRAVAYAKLEPFYKTNPELFAVERAPSTPWRVVDGDPSPWMEPPVVNHDDEAEEDFCDVRNWRHSAKGNLWRPYRGLTITIFADVKFGGGLLKWCVSDSSPRFSRQHFGAVDEAIFACWAEYLAPRFGLAP